MLKKICIYAACLAGAHLSAESIGNVEFQFPPSNYEWKMLVDNQSAENFFSSPEFDSEESEEQDCQDCSFKVFTHREGDALELFTALQAPKDNDDQDNTTSTLAAVQNEIDALLNQFLPNHRFNILDLKGSGEERFMEYELSDGITEIMHGYSRYFLKDGSFTVLSYWSTALPTEHNRILWTEALNNAR